MSGGQPFMRSATAEDCRVYPNLRLIITSNGMETPMYDGPAFDWDTRMPIIQYTVDDWAWEPLGRSLVGDVHSIETTLRKIERKMDAVTTVTLNPPLGYNHTETGGPKIEHFDIFEEDIRIGVDGTPSTTLQSVLPDSVRVSEIHFKFLEYLGVKRDKQLGLSDLGNLQNMKLQIASDTADKMLESIGPVAKGIAARIEKGNKQVGARMKYLILQWFDTRRIMEYVGPESMAPEIFDFNPDELVPSHMPDEMVSGNFPDGPSMYTKLDRARWFVRNIRLTSVPNTLLKITQMQRQLMLLQLKKAGAPISWSLVMKNLDIQNFGEAKGTTEFQKWWNEEVEMTKLKILAQAQAAKFMQELGIQPPGEEGGKGGGPGQGKGGGRPNTNAKPPRLAQKGGAGGDPRSVIKTS